MSDAAPGNAAAVRLLSNAAPVAPGAVLALPAELMLELPPGRRLAQARLELAAAPDDTAEQAIDPAGIATDAGAFAANAAIRFIGVDLGHERTVTDIEVERGASAPPGASWRARALSDAVWTPLAPPDALPLAATAGGQTPGIRFAPVAATRLAIELLVPYGNTTPAPLVPGPAAVARLVVKGTAQPCHVAVGIGSDVPFFTRTGPLPAIPVPVDGLARAVNRFLLETPGADAVPIRLAAAAPGRIVVARFVADLAPAPPEPPAPPSDVPLLPIATAYLSPSDLTAGAAQLCDGAHDVAQGFAALPRGKALTRIDLYLGPGEAPAQASLAVHADSNGVPAAEAVAGTATPLRPDPAATGPAWATASLTAPVACRDAWWVVLRVAAGDCLWFTDNNKPPAGAQSTLARAGAGSWAPAASAPSGWAQARLWTVDAP